MSTNRLYHSWFERIRQLCPHERITRLRNLVWLMLGIFQSKSVHLSKIASKIPGWATQPSLTRRLSRFLDNAAVRVHKWYEPVARNLLQAMASTVGEVRLIADGSKVGFQHQLLIVAIAYRRRAIPIAWTWVHCVKGHSFGDYPQVPPALGKGCLAVKASVAAATKTALMPASRT